jgi:hypothetical protein
LNFGHCDLPFDLAQGGGELVEPFGICDLLFEIFIADTFSLLQHVVRKNGLRA